MVHQTSPGESAGESAAADLTEGQPQPLTPLGRSGGPYHVTTQFSFYPVMSKLQHSINIYPWFWNRLTCPSQDFRNSWCFECDIIMVQHCDVTAVVLHTMLCSQRQLATSTTELTLLTMSLECDKQVIWKISNAGSWASYGPYHALELPDHRIKVVTLVRWLEVMSYTPLTHLQPPG